MHISEYYRFFPSPIMVAIVRGIKTKISNRGAHLQHTDNAV